MKKFCFIMTTLLIAATAAVAQKTIRVSTDNTDLIMQVNNNGRLYMVYLGDSSSMLQMPTGSTGPLTQDQTQA